MRRRTHLLLAANIPRHGVARGAVGQHDEVGLRVELQSVVGSPVDWACHRQQRAERSLSKHRRRQMVVMAHSLVVHLGRDDLTPPHLVHQVLAEEHHVLAAEVDAAWVGAEVHVRQQAA